MAHKKGAGSTRNGRDSAGQRLGVNGTPVIVLENGHMLPGYLPPDKLLQALSAASAKSAKVSN